MKTSASDISRRSVLTGLAAGTAALPPDACRLAVQRGRTVDRRVHLCRVEGRLRLQSSPCCRRRGREALGVKVVEEERVPETIDVEKTMASMINLDGSSLLFPTSFGYFDPHVLKVAKKYDAVSFMHCGGLWKEGDPKNAHSYFGYIDEAQFLSGIVAAHVTKTKNSASSQPSPFRRCCATSMPSCWARGRSIPPSRRR